MRFLHSNMLTNEHPEKKYSNSTKPINVMSQNLKYPETITVVVIFSSIKGLGEVPESEFRLSLRLARIESPSNLERVEEEDDEKEEE